MKRRLDREIRETTLDSFVSHDAPMQACLTRARLAARTDLPVLLLGESGTGKTLLARAIHNSSGRTRGPFISFNAAALSETLLDSQLFGHERGAFTGASSRVKGKFELADGGTLFFDEVADLSPQGQSKILRAIEYGEFERLGSEALQEADVRVLSATHYPVSTLAKNGTFRADLFHRLNGMSITVPPLRERPHDLRVLLADGIGAASRAQEKAIEGLDPDAVELLLAYEWPGNLRELAKVTEAAVALAEDTVIRADVLRMLLDPAGFSTPHQASRAARRSMRLEDAVRHHIEWVLDEVRGNKRRAARELGVARATLERKLKEMA